MELLGRTLQRALTRRGAGESNTARLLVRQIQSAIAQTRAIARGLTPVMDNPNGLMLALEDLVDRLGKDGAVFMTMEDAAREADGRLSRA